MARMTLVGVAIVAALFIQHSWAAQYNVGGSQGWEATTDFKTWVSDKQFKVGDTLGKFKAWIFSLPVKMVIQNQQNYPE